MLTLPIAEITSYVSCPKEDKSLNLTWFLKRALAHLEEDRYNLTLMGHIHPDSGKQVHLGFRFIEALRKVALPEEVASAEARYGIRLSSLASKVSLKASEVLGFILQIHDGIGISEDVLSSQSLVSELKSRHVMSSLAERIALSAQLGEINNKNLRAALKKDHIKLYKDLFRLGLSSHTMTHEQFQEVLSKKVATAFLAEGMRIPLPRLVGDDGTIHTSGELHVHKVISHKGLMAFALKPSNAPDFVKPMILFRPTTANRTHEGAFETLIDDLRQNTGKRSYQGAKDALFSMLNDPKFLVGDQKAHLCGFSLGGAHAARLLAEIPEKFSKAFFFNDPSTESSVAEQFIERLSQSSHDVTNPLEIHICHTERDLVTLKGERHIGHIPSGHRLEPVASSKCRVVFKKVETSDVIKDTSPTPTRLGELFHRSQASSRKLKRKIHTKPSLISLSPRKSSGSASSEDSISSLSTESTVSSVRRESLDQLDLANNAQAVAINSLFRRHTSLRRVLMGILHVISAFAWLKRKCVALFQKTQLALHEQEFIKRYMFCHNLFKKGKVRPLDRTLHLRPISTKFF